MAVDPARTPPATNRGSRTVGSGLWLLLMISFMLWLVVLALLAGRWIG